MSVIGSKAIFLNIPSQQFAGGTNVYTLAQQVSSVNSISVVIDGIKQFSTAYTVSNFTLTFSEVVATSSVIEVIYLTSRGIVNTVADSSITALKYADNSISAAKLIDGVVTNTKLATNSVDTSKVIDGNITLLKLASNSVDSSKIVDATITQSKLAPGVGPGPAFSAYQSTGQSTSATIQKMLFQSEEFDTNNAFASSRFTPSVPGYYQVSAQVKSAGKCTMYIYKSGASYKIISNGATAADYQSGSCLVYLNGTSDYVEIYHANPSATATSTGAENTYFQACMIRGA